MALIECRACKHAIAEHAASCPGCGAPASSAPSNSFWVRHWRGEYSLPRSYWVNSFLVSMCLAGVALALRLLLQDQPARYGSAATLALTALSLALWVWSARGTWVSATRHARAGRKWGGLAKAVIVLGCLRSVAALVQASAGFIEHGQTAMGRQAGPDFTVRLAADGTSVHISGGMNDGAAERLREALRGAPSVSSVVLSSTGGWVREGQLVAEVIAERKLSTLAQLECSSACTIAFLAGSSRTLAPGARLGFHQIRSVGSLDGQRSPDVALTRRAYDELGLPAPFIAKIAATPHNQMWYPSSSELLAAGVITESTEWEGYREALTTRLSASLLENMKVFEAPRTTLDALLQCELDGHIRWLNLSGCSYHYDQARVSLQDHLNAQDACLQAAGYVEESIHIDVVCSKRHIPNDWSFLEPMLSKKFAASLSPREPDAPRARARGECVAKEYARYANRSGCPLLNMEAQTAELLFSGDACVEKQRGFRASVNRMIARCAAR
jgi:hypothetical protein